jgi:hypothetical protein
MKNKLFLIVISILAFNPSKACDICGCGVGSNYIGILPEFSNKIIGLRYRYNSLQTHIGAGGTITYLTTNEKYNTVEAWGGWNITPKIRVMASVPYAFNERQNQGITSSKNGLGDISANGFYQLISSRTTINKSKLLVQSLWVGGGIKLPTGNYNPADKESGTENTNLFQLGTASVDFTLNAMYDIRLQDVGLNTVVGYKINTTNKYEYNYGNKLNLSTQAYYKIKAAKKITIAPNAGVAYETAQKDIDNKFAVDVSGGNLFLGTVGIETVFKKLTVGGNFQTPFSQNLANGFVKAHDRVMVHVAVVL